MIGARPSASLARFAAATGPVGGASGRLAFIGAVLLASSCARHQIRDLPRDGTPETTVAWDTETVCSRRDAAAYTQLPLASATWRDLAMRADARPADWEALWSIAQLMRANRERFADSACTARSVAAVEASAERAAASHGEP